MNKTRIKVVLVGDENTGKSSLINSYIHGRFNEQYIPTVFENFGYNTVVNGKQIDLQLCDTGGKDEFETYRPVSYPETDIFVVIFSLDQSSETVHDKIKNKWIPEIRKSTKSPILLVGTKSDLLKNNSDGVTLRKGIELANELKLIQYIECSSKTGEGVHKVFNDALSSVIRKKNSALTGNISFFKEDSLNSLINDLKVLPLKKDPTVLDEKLIKILHETDSFPIELKDEAVFQNCVLHNLHQVLVYMILKQPDFYKPFIFKKGANILFKIVHEDVVLKLFENYSENLLHQNKENARKENVLHHFISKRYEKAINYLIENDLILNFCFSFDKAGNSPLMSMVSQNMGTLPLKVWNCMERTSNKDVLGESVWQKNHNSYSNLLHLCSENKQNKLLLTIIKSKKLPSEFLYKAINGKNVDDRTVLDMCEDQETLLQILEAIDPEKVNFGYLDRKKNTMLHHFAKTNYRNTIAMFYGHYERGKFKKMLFHLNENQNNVFMSSALANSNETLVYLLSIFPAKEMTRKEVGRILHKKNVFGNTLLSITLQQIGTLVTPKHILLQMEKEFHKIEENGIESLAKCFKDNLMPSNEVMQILKDVEESLPKTQFQQKWVWVKTCIGSLLVPVSVLALDIFSDIILVIKYAGLDEECIAINYQHCLDRNLTMLNNLDCPIDNFSNTAYSCIPVKLGATPRFLYSLGFIVSPWIYYFIEFFTSGYYTQLQQNIKTSIANFGYSLSCIGQIFMLLLTAVNRIVFWPIVMHGTSFHSKGKYLTSHGPAKIKALKEHAENTVISSRAHIIEVSSESSFQPVLQMYLLLPTLVASFSTVRPVWKMSLDSFVGSIYHMQLWSVLTSVLSLAWSFSFYQAVKKQGALDFGTNLVGRVLLLMSNIFQISSRLLLLVFLAYCFGPGEFWPMFALLILHIILMALSYFTFYREQMHDDSWPGCIYQCILNGISNIYLHTLILPIDNQTKGTRKNLSTRKRQVFVDFVFTAENIIIATASSSLIEDIPTALLVLVPGAHVLGIMLKWLYYYKFHIWHRTLGPSKA